MPNSERILHFQVETTADHDRTRQAQEACRHTIVESQQLGVGMGETIKVHLKIWSKIGHAPKYIICDDVTSIGKAVRNAGYMYHLNISHILDIFLERMYRNKPGFPELSKKTSSAAKGTHAENRLHPVFLTNGAWFMNMYK